MTLATFTQNAPTAAGLALALSAAFAHTDSTAGMVRPPGYKPLKGYSAMGEALFKDTKLPTNGMACATCHAHHGSFSANFAKPYPHTVAMARDQLGRNSVFLDEMEQT